MKKIDAIQKKIDLILNQSLDPFGVRKSTAYIVKNSCFVSVNQNKISDFAKLIRDRIRKNKPLSYNQFGELNNSPQLIFLQDTINFCFWAKKGEPKWTVEYPKGIVQDGWAGLTACFDRAISEGIPILDCNYLKDITLDDARYIFRSTNQVEIPLLKERTNFLKQTANNLNQYFDGNAKNLIKKAQNNAVTIVKAIIKYFPSFRDFSIYEKRKINFLKRAQICAYDFSLLSEEKISNTDYLTIFADYKLPQILRTFGILQYNKKLANKIGNLILLEKNSLEEIEIRSATIWACELIAQEVQVAPSIIDNAIWYLSNNTKRKIKPYHRVLTTNY